MYGLNLPNLTMGNHHISSKYDHHYNCVSHSILEEAVPLWPDNYNHWPASVQRTETIDAFVEFFKCLHFEDVPLLATLVTPGYWKVAIYADSTGFPLHVARQLVDGRWTSKLGLKVDINHENLQCLEGGDFGYVVKIMRHQRTGVLPELPPLVPPKPLIYVP